MNVPGNAAISFDTELTRTELEEKLNNQECYVGMTVMEMLDNLGISYPTVTVAAKPIESDAS